MYDHKKECGIFGMTKFIYTITESKYFMQNVGYPIFREDGDASHKPLDIVVLSKMKQYVLWTS